ncbi:hypothetical protein QY95_03089 [Bacillus thermotolerans]|uniref:Uncharacterized protein n=1 Tax=Bacillus thermotolerans TaxID=1221996 RepID=A0A0F5ICS6_BACTR|nr:hypothetical protein QY95_03089 [Bacillus thermotolerans]
MSMQAMITFASMNLKKVANWTWQGPVFFINRVNTSKKPKKGPE